MVTTNPEAVGLCSVRLQRVEDLMADYVKNGELAGTVTLVARNGKVVHLAEQGSMNITANQPMQSDTIFRIYSMTKPVTAIAAMILYERGKFDLTTPISKFIPEFKDVEVYVSGTSENYTTVKPEREITMVDLLTHTAGLTYDYTNVGVVDELYRKAGITAFNFRSDSAEFARRVAKAPLLFSPGKYFNYSVATDILGHIVEIISGMTLEEFFKREIFDVLGMEDTGFYVPAEKQSRFSVNYMQRNIAPPTLTEKNPDQKLFVIDDPMTGQFATSPVMYSGGGGLVSTAEDYFKFANMLVNNGLARDRYLVSPKTIALMTKNHLPGEMNECRYIKDSGSFQPGVGVGLGFGMTLDTVRTGMIGNAGDFGWSGAANTYFFVDPKERLVAIMLTQLFPFDLQQEMYRQFKVAVYQSIMD